MKFQRKLSRKEVENRVEKFISLRQSKGDTTISALDLVLKLKIPAPQIENVLEKFQKERNLKEISG
ncbi:MAG: hypothetical protein AAB819_01680 [Patescibacteria group bacterium]